MSKLENAVKDSVFETKPKRTKIRVWLLIGAILPAVAHAQFNYMDTNGTITITGYTGVSGTVTIPSTYNGTNVTSIGTDAFENRTVMKTVTIPVTVVSILDGAFYNCTHLTNITIVGNSLVSIGNGAFENCYGLTSVTIPNNVVSIGAGPFEGCSALTNISATMSNPDYSSSGGILFNKALTTLIQFPGGLGGSYLIPTNVTSIGGEAFGYCSGLTNVPIGGDVTNIGAGAFEDCSGLTSVNIPAGVTSVGIGVFDNCYDLTSVTISNDIVGDGEFEYCYDLTNVSIGSEVTSIGDQAFYDCFDLAGVTIPDSVTNIGGNVFYNCSLLSVTIPSSVTGIGNDAFGDCSSLTSAYFQGNAPSNDGTVFSGDATTVYYLPGTTGWGSKFGNGLPVLWNPQAAAFSVSDGHLGFNITGPTNAVIVVVACTNLANPVWVPVSTNTLSVGMSPFNDSNWTSYPNRYYRFSAP